RLPGQPGPGARGRGRAARPAAAARGTDRSRDRRPVRAARLHPGEGGAVGRPGARRRGRGGRGVAAGQGSVRPDGPGDGGKAMSPVLVTGGNGYLGTQLVAALLRDGRAVRATVRSTAREAGLREAVRRGGADDADLEVVEADLMADHGWKAAVAGCEEVHHLATPFPAVQPEDPDELIVPAREGTLRVLRAARDTGARRVVLTSSFAAIGYTPKPSADKHSGEFTEDDWTDPDTPGLPPYPKSKAIAERAAWDFIRGEGGGTELVVV